jgi:transposase
LGGKWAYNKMAYRKDTTMETAHLQQEEAAPGSAAKLIREVKQKTRKRLSSEDKIRIVLEGFRRELPVSDLCRKENISTPIYYSWLKDFMEAGKARLKGDGLRDATKSEVRSLRDENDHLKELWKKGTDLFFEK